MTHDKDSIEAQLAAVKQGFIDQLPNRMQSIFEAQKTWLISTGNGPELEEYHRLVHSLTGSSATFGLTQISADSRALEQHLKTLKEKTKHDNKDLAEVKRLLKVVLVNAASPS